MKKIFLLISGSLILGGCVKMNNEKPLIESFIKSKNRATNIEQRWKDAEACGAKRVENDRISFEFDPPEKYIPEFNHFCDCMKSKGYLYDDWLY